MTRKLQTCLVAGLLITFSLQQTLACPFCTAVSQTFSEEMGGMDIVVIAELLKSKKSEPKEKVNDKVAELQSIDGTAVNNRKFKILKIVKGKEYLQAGQVFTTVAFGDIAPGDKFLVMGVEPPKVTWTTPLKMSQRAIEYISELKSLPKEGAGRLEFFQKYLQDKEDMLARDAYDEFANAPYKHVIALKPKMDRKKLISWIKDPDIPSSRKRLYYTMLGVCGTKADLPILEELMKSNDRLKKAGLDALVACYLTLKGADGMTFIEDLFIKNKKSDYSDTYAAISALRFHGTETDVIPQKRILKGLHYMLDRPKLADLVIPDLARWEDWSVMDRLVKLFKESTDDTSWVRVPVINYLRACPMDVAKDHIKALEKIDPEAVKRANTFFPLPDDDEEDEDESTEDDTSSEKSEGDKKKTEKTDDTSSEKSVSEKESDAAANGKVSKLGELETCTPNVDDNLTNGNANQLVNHTEEVTTESVADASSVTSIVENDSNLVAQSTESHTLMVLGIPFLVGGFLFVLLWLVISGRIDRIAF